MDSSEKERVPSIDELCSKIPILSEYCRKLDDHVKRRYLEKIAEVGGDPVTIPDEQFKVPLRRKFLFLFSPFSHSNPFNEYVIAKLAIN